MIGRFLRRSGNWVLYRVWTDCRHLAWAPTGYADQICPGCGAER